MPPIERIDEIDAKILKDLLIEGRKEFTKIAKEIKVSKDVIWQHYNNMMKKKIIVGATIQLDYTVLGYDISANFIVDTPTNQQQQVMKDLRKIGGIYDAYRWGSPSRIWAVTGLMKTDQIELVKQKIKKVPSVLRVEVEIWTGLRNTPENLSILTNTKKAVFTEKKDSPTGKRDGKKPNKIDELDRRLIEELSVNNRVSFNQISKKLDTSASTIIRRYTKLERNHIIRSLIQINPARIGYTIQASFRLIIDSHEGLNNIAVGISEIPDVSGVLKTSGKHDLTVFTAIKSFEHLFAVEHEIVSIPGVREVETPALSQLSILPYPREHISTF